MKSYTEKLIDIVLFAVAYILLIGTIMLFASEDIFDFYENVRMWFMLGLIPAIITYVEYK